MPQRARRRRGRSRRGDVLVMVTDGIAADFSPALAGGCGAAQAERIFAMHSKGTTTRWRSWCA